MRVRSPRSRENLITIFYTTAFVGGVAALAGLAVLDGLAAAANY